MSADKLLWDLAAADGLCVAPVLPAPYYSKIRRALQSLEARPLVVMTRRKLLTLAEVVRWLPFKTRQASVKALREEFLPILSEFVGRKHRGKFSEAESEEYVLGKISDEHHAEWCRLSTRMRAAIVSTGADRTLIELLVKGDSLFGDGELGSRSPMSNFLVSARAAASSTDVKQLVEEVIELYRACLPRDRQQHARLKSQLHTAVVFPNHGRPGLTADFEKYLRRFHHTSISKLPGHRVSEFGPEFDDLSPTLHQLITPEVFRDYSFVSPHG